MWLTRQARIGQVRRRAPACWTRRRRSGRGGRRPPRRRSGCGRGPGSAPGTPGCAARRRDLVAPVDVEEAHVVDQRRRRPARVRSTSPAGTGSSTSKARSTSLDGKRLTGAITAGAVGAAEQAAEVELEPAHPPGQPGGRRPPRGRPRRRAPTSAPPDDDAGRPGRVQAGRRWSASQADVPAGRGRRPPACHTSTAAAASPAAEGHGHHLPLVGELLVRPAAGGTRGRSRTGRRPRLRWEAL